MIYVSDDKLDFIVSLLICDDSGRLAPLPINIESDISSCSTFRCRTGKFLKLFCGDPSQKNPFN